MSFYYEMMSTVCKHCGAEYKLHKRRGEYCPKDGKYISIWTINKEEPWKEVKQEWEKTRFERVDEKTI